MYVTFSISVFNCGLSIFNKRILLSTNQLRQYTAVDSACAEHLRQFLVELLKSLPQHCLAVIS